ncbi:MAG TPA: hypothetical protein VF787_03415 [Thermoanaerobaculia bacterium]
MAERKIVQIAVGLAVFPESVVQGSPKVIAAPKPTFMIAAVADDGTAFELDTSGGKRKWVELPPLPEALADAKVP